MREDVGYRDDPNNNKNEFVFNNPYFWGFYFTNDKLEWLAQMSPKLHTHVNTTHAQTHIHTQGYTNVLIMCTHIQ